MRIQPVFLLFLLVIVLVGCKEEDPIDMLDSRSYLHVLGGASIADFDVVFDYYGGDNVVITDFSYHRNFPIEGYASLQATRTPDVYGNGKMWLSAIRSPFSNLPPDTLLQPEELELVAEEKATLCFADSLGHLVTVKMVDSLTILDSSKAYVRFVNLAADQVWAHFYLADSSYSQDSVGFLQYTDFVPVPSGYQTFEVSHSSSTVMNSLSATLYESRFYTYYLSGSGSGNLNNFVH